MEEEDPVVQEIPVYLSQALSQNLYIYQYPVKPGNKNWTEAKILNAAVKPKNRLVRLEVGLDTYSDKYCSSKGEQIALNTDGQQESSWHIKEKDKSLYFRSGTMDKIVYESSTPCVDTKHYAVAVLHDKELHCTPIQGIIQMRPSYSYYDKQEKKNNEKATSEKSEDEESEVEAQKVTVKFARQETEVAKKAREKSYESMSQRIKDEAWHEASWKHSDTDHADLERLKLFGPTSSDGSALTLRAREYIRAMVPPPPADEADVAPIKRPTAQEQVKELLLSAKVMTFNDIRAMIRVDDAPISDTALVSALSGAACCVRGVWAARSQDLYTNAAPVPPRLMCAARDHILYLLTQHTYVDRLKVTASVRLPPESVLEILRSVTKYNPRTGWELLIPPDAAFEAKYPDVMQRQNMAWEARQRQFNEMIMRDCEITQKRPRKKSQRDSFCSETLMSPKLRCNSVSEDDNERKRQKNKSITGGGKRTRNVSSGSTGVNEVS